MDLHKRKLTWGSVGSADDHKRKIAKANVFNREQHADNRVIRTRE
jgi:hypothetical protein